MAATVLGKKAPRDLFTVTGGTDANNVVAIVSDAI